MRLSLFVIIGAVLNVTNGQVSGQKAYFFNTQFKMNWFQANVFCETNNMRLVSIHSLEEHNLVVRRAHELGSIGEPWWTAGNDLAEEGQFYWGFSRRKAYTNWSKGQPDNSRGIEHCTAIWPDLWNDIVCTAMGFTICEYYLNPRQVRAGNLTLDEIRTRVPLSFEQYL